MKNKGITLIATIITVIVLLIITVVTINIVTSDSSIISKGEIAVYENSITQIEQWLNEVYVQNYAEMPDASNKALSLIEYFENDKKLQRSKYSWGDAKTQKDNVFKIRTTDSIVNKEDRWKYTKDTSSFYCLNINNLLKVNNSIDVSENVNDIDNMKGVYAVTADLKVFLILDWDANELLGINKEDIV